jgi:histidine triad (HIT) family protein
MNTTEQQSCIFCKIIAGTIPSKIIAQNDQTLAIQDITPKAPIHYLIIPKTHIKDVSSLPNNMVNIPGELFMMAQKLALDLPGDKSFRLVVNNGAGAGQSVFHLHMHLLAGGFYSESSLCLPESQM